ISNLSPRRPMQIIGKIGLCNFHYKPKNEDPLRNMARPPRLERGTLCLEGRCSIQLSYGRFATTLTVLPPQGKPGKTNRAAPAALQALPPLDTVFPCAKLLRQTSCSL